MNLLVDQLPTAVEVDGVVYKIRADYRDCLNIIIMFEDLELSDFEKQSLLLELFYYDIPGNAFKAAEMAVKFLNCGEPPTLDETDNNVQVERLYSFSKDGNYIFSAINQTHGIDIESIPFLHYWKFVSLFTDISEECFFSRLIYLRKQHKKGKLSKEEREMYESIRNVVELEPTYTKEEKENFSEFKKLFNEKSPSQ